ncbi:MAG: hypothetical protein QXQ50_09280 [Candidatus Bathyarchaeia archaeon]
MQIEMKKHEQENWVDIFVENKYIGYICTNEKGELYIYIYKNSVREVSIG